MNTSADSALPRFTANPLWEKEIRLLRPAFLAALPLAVAPVWLLGMFHVVGGESLRLVIPPLWCGALFLAISSFGREFGLNTFPLLLAQPAERMRIWKTKLTVLAIALLVVFSASALSTLLWRPLHLGTQVNPWLAENGGFAGLAIALLVILASGLWTTLLLRQMASAFWVALLVPLTILLVILAMGGNILTVEVALALYSFAALAWARREFLRAQEAPRTGGEVTISRWRTTQALADRVDRTGGFIRALLWQNLGWFQISLLAVATWYLADHGFTGSTVLALAFSVALWTAGLARFGRLAFWGALLLTGSVVGLALWLGNFVSIVGGASPESIRRSIYLTLGLHFLAGLGLAVRQVGQSRSIEDIGTASSALARETAGRIRRPLPASCRKELKLHQVGLFGMAGLFLVHLGVLWLRQNPVGEIPVLHTLLDEFGGLWLLVAVLTAGQSVAEERRLGTWESQLCQPVSSRRQFAVKLLFVLGLDGLLSGALLWLAEGLGAGWGASHGLGGIEFTLAGNGLGTILAITVALALVAFHASTMSRNLMQSVALTILTALTLLFCVSLARSQEIELLFNPLLALIAWPALAGVLITLSLGNFRRPIEVRRLAIRNILVLAIALVGIVAVTGAIYRRAWELVIPADASPGPARMSLASPPRFQSTSLGTVVILPDGRLWQNRFHYEEGILLGIVGTGTPIHAPGQWQDLPGLHFANGSNWLAQATVNAQYVAIRSDGTLWSSERAVDPFEYQPDTSQLLPQKPAPLVQFGNERDWKMVIPDPGQGAVLLLKTNGTLWRWGGSSYAEPGLRAHAPHQLGAEADWAELYHTGVIFFARKQSGQVWAFDFYREKRWHSNGYEPAGHQPDVRLDAETGLDRVASLDDIHWRNVEFPRFGVREDGTLWELEAVASQTGATLNPVRIGQGNDWVAAKLFAPNLVALKADGSLWRWEYHSSEWSENRQRVPTRMGKRQDWVGLGTSGHGIVALAADGGLWDWSGRDVFSDFLVPSRRPRLMQNIFERP